MSSRDKILKEIKANKPAVVALPDMDAIDALVYADPLTVFSETLSSIGGKVVLGDNDLTALKKLLQEKQEQGLITITDIPELDSNANDYVKHTSLELEKVDLLVIKGTFAVAENGAVWLEEKNLVHRLLPFICQHLVLIVDASAVVSNMHEAYRRIPGFDQGFGVFIAGPSKTADIEQSLVLGAHGALSLTVWLVNNDFD